MKNGKAGAPSDVTSELLKLPGSSGTNELLIIFNQIMFDCNVPVQWTETLTAVIFNGKGDPLKHNKHRGLKLLENSMKVLEKRLDGRLRSVTHTMDG